MQELYLILVLELALQFALPDTNIYNVVGLRVGVCIFICQAGPTHLTNPLLFINLPLMALENIICAIAMTCHRHII